MGSHAQRCGPYARTVRPHALPTSVRPYEKAPAARRGSVPRGDCWRCSPARRRVPMLTHGASSGPTLEISDCPQSKYDGTPVPFSVSGAESGAGPDPIPTRARGGAAKGGARRARPPAKRLQNRHLYLEAGRTARRVAGRLAGRVFFEGEKASGTNATRITPPPPGAARAHRNRNRLILLCLPRILNEGTDWAGFGSSGASGIDRMA